MDLENLESLRTEGQSVLVLPPGEQRGEEQISLPFAEPTNSDYVLKKHKAIIHRTHFPTAVEEKLFNAFLIASKVSFKSGSVDKFMKEGFQTSVKFIRSFSGLKTKNLEHVIERVRMLQTSLIRFDYFDQYDVFKELRSFTPISEVRFAEDGSIRYFLPPSLLEVISNPETFAAIDTQITSRFVCVYAIAIYEMGVIHLGGSVNFAIDAFREYMGLKPGEYVKTADLRRYVIDKGCNEVNEKSGTIAVEYELVKEGRGGKVKSIRLTFSEAPEPLEIPANEFQLELVARYCAKLPFSLSGEGFVISLLKKNLDEHGEEWVDSNIEAFLARLSAPGQPPVGKPGALLRTTLKFDYGAEIRDAKKVREILAANEQARLALKEVEARDVAKVKQVLDEGTKAEIEEIRTREAAYLSYFESMPTPEQAEVLRGMEKTFLFGSREFKLMHYLSEQLGIAL